MSTEATAAVTEGTPAPAATVTADQGVLPGAAPAPAPAPAPAAATVEPTKTDAGKPEPYEYEKTNNPNVDYALGIIGKAGFGLDHPASQAALNGDFSLLQHALVAAGVPGAPELVGMLEKAHAQEVEDDKATSLSIVKDLHEIFGGEEQWKAVREWAGSNAEPEEKATINTLLGDPKTHKIAAHYLSAMYNASGGEREAPANVAKADAVASAPAPGNTPLTRAQFSQEAAKLYKTHGDNYTNTPEYAALGRRLV